ncbi:fimbrial protein [Stenotrophomonas tumulicola]|uniref:Type 1 fimbrial protein n=1 Tax=Stenotrophomonas tumulicola TaxID=1685415 RepID=A0A7W3FLR6_9GAMM|nr:hypothetical protein [Stenotrophomonas tumulicola]MBA8681552.1 hypothetical protein [Stenotrophomonas tumulicola]
MNIRALALAGALVLAGESQAQTAQVTFSGNLLPTTCVVNVRTNGGSLGGDGTLVLAPVPAKDLANPGDRTGRRIWQVIVGNDMEQCLAPRVQVGFRNAGKVNAEGRLSNSGTARNVDIVISNAEIGSGNPDIDLTSNKNSQVRDIPPATGWVTLTYASEYYATTRATGGTVATSVQYDLIYP